MVQPTSGFHVYSDLNTWIDFMIVIDIYENFSKSRKNYKGSRRNLLDG